MTSRCIFFTFLYLAVANSLYSKETLALQTLHIGALVPFDVTNERDKRMTADLILPMVKIALKDIERKALLPGYRLQLHVNDTQVRALKSARTSHASGMIIFLYDNSYHLNARLSQFSETFCPMLDNVKTKQATKTFRIAKKSQPSHFQTPFAIFDLNNHLVGWIRLQSEDKNKYTVGQNTYTNMLDKAASTFIYASMLYASMFNLRMRDFSETPPLSSLTTDGTASL